LIPYATAEAYRLIEETLRHEYLWSEDRMAFLGTTLETDEPLEKADGMDGIQGWDDAARGWWSFRESEPEQDPQAHIESDVPIQEATPLEAAPEPTSKRSTKTPTKAAKAFRHKGAR